MLLSVVKKIISVVMIVTLIASIAVTGFAESESPVMAVLWPNEIPFKIIVAQNGKQGMIYSDEFEVVNMGDNDVAIEINAARIQIESDDNYCISDTRELPESGSNIFIELLCLDAQEPSSTVLTDTASEIVHTYHLQSGEVGKFKFDGSVNEIGGPSWGDTVVQIHLSFHVAISEPIISAEEQLAEAENDEEIVNGDFSNDEALTPPQEATHDADVAADTTEADNTNDADNKDVQEPQPDTETDIEESDRAVDDDVDAINNQADSLSDIKSD